MRARALTAAKQEDELGILVLARAWKLGVLLPVHPTIGQRFNQALVVAGEEPVPFQRSTNPQAKSLVDLIMAEYGPSTSVQPMLRSDAKSPSDARQMVI